MAKTTPEWFPIMGHRPIPWVLIAPHVRQAEINHAQTLEQLARRGGLDAKEAVAVLEDKRWQAVDLDGGKARERLDELVAAAGARAILELAEARRALGPAWFKNGETLAEALAAKCRLLEQAGDHVSRAIFRNVPVRFDRATVATVTIERGPELVHVRLYRRRRVYTLPLGTVAEMVAWSIVKAEAREKLAAKRAKRGRR